MKTFVGAISALTLLFVITSCGEVKFQSKMKDSTQSCVGNGCATPYTYAWVQGGYNGSCSVPCGGGVEMQTVTCQRSDGVTVIDSMCSGTKPASSRACNVQICTATYTWNIGQWSVCSKSCGGGSQNRTVVCQTDNGTTVADGYCTTAKPPVQQTCNNQACPPQYIYGWQLVPGQCSKPCDGGLEKFVCKRNDDTLVSDTYCTDPKPNVSCNTQACTVNYTYSWITGSWNVCSKTCGSGTRTRDVTCQRSDGQFVASSFCASQSQPASQEVCNSQACPVTGRDVTTTKTLPLPAVDIVMVIDDSSSMAADNLKLAQRMGGFISDLDSARIDYRVCITSTDVRPLKPAGAAPGPYGWYGMPLKWGYYSGTNFVAGSHLMTNDTPNRSTLFNDTIKYLGAGYSSDEQGINAVHLMIDGYGNSGCFRTNSTLAVILISDEDERSVGGIQAWSPAQYQPLQPNNYPASLVSKVAATWGAGKTFIWNSIIVKPGDTQCEALQDSQGTPCFFGTKYNELSNLTGGYVGSICAADYSENLKYIKNRVVSSMPNVALECTPTGTPTVTITPNVSTSVSVEGNLVKFNPALPEGTTVKVQYRCPN